ncbi:MAG TPA: CRISPR-associated endoribonuclease Cas6 [Ktedonobacteraceae bacterium]|nr:CRISPR-associated endoribonuclease Cas6 [Ktedonobacteraceae bacterium]
MTQVTTSQTTNARLQSGELFSMLLRLHPVEAGKVSPGSGNHIQAAFLDMVRQADPALAEALHAPNQRRPYTLSLLQGFNQLSKDQLAAATNKNQQLSVSPGQVYWLRITMLNATLFGSFVQYLILKSRALTFRIGDTRFEISRLLASPQAPNIPQSSWVSYSSFAELRMLQPAQHTYLFEFASPTAFSKGQKAWGKLLKLFPEAPDVFESLAKQWETYAPADLRLAAQDLSSERIADWCAENVILSRYTLETRYLPSSKFGQTGFLGEANYEVKGNPHDPEARWLSTLARFALFSGVGYKTAMGMGQTRCSNLKGSVIKQEASQEDTP